MPLVFLQPQTFSRIEEYANLAKVSTHEAVDDAVNEWMDTTGEPIQDELNYRRSQSGTYASKSLPVPEINTCNTVEKSGTISNIEESPKFTAYRRPMQHVLPVLMTGTGRVASQSF